MATVNQLCADAFDALALDFDQRAAAKYDLRYLTDLTQAIENPGIRPSEVQALLSAAGALENLTSFKDEWMSKFDVLLGGASFARVFPFPDIVQGEIYVLENEMRLPHMKAKGSFQRSWITLWGNLSGSWISLFCPEFRCVYSADELFPYLERWKALAEYLRKPPPPSHLWDPFRTEVKDGKLVFDAFDAVRQFAEEHTKGITLSGLVALCDANGKLDIEEFASLVDTRNSEPKKAFAYFKGKADPIIQHLGFHVRQHGIFARLELLPEQTKKAKRPRKKRGTKTGQKTGQMRDDKRS